MGANNSPIDRLRSDLEEWNASTVPEDVKEKYGRKNTLDALSLLPVVGNVMAIPDTYRAAQDTITAAQEGRGKATAGNAALTGLGLLNVLSPLPTGRSAARAAKGAASRTNIFVGPEAKTANLDELDVAERLREAGASRDEIWSKTGWAWDERGKPYFEIDDSASVFGTKNRNPQTVGEVIKHPELFAARPDLEALAFRMEPRLGEGGGSYGRPGLEEAYPRGSISLGNQNTVAKAHGVTIHELQHGADYERGGSYGASYQSPSPSDLEAAANMLRTRYGEAFTNWERARDNYQAALRDTTGRFDPQRAMDAVSAAEVELAKAQGARNAVLPKDIAYTNNPGEARARNADTRMSFNAAERRAIPPWHTLDVDEADILADAKPFAEAKPQVFIPAENTPSTAKALEMRQEGVQPHRIWAETERMIAPEGGVKREIPDTGMRFRSSVIQPGVSGTVEEMVSHPQLYHHFPWLGERKLSLTGEIDHLGQPVARTTAQGNFQLNPSQGAEPLAKLFQYEIAAAEGMPKSLRHGADAADMAIENTRRNVNRLKIDDPGDHDAVQAYLQSLGAVEQQYADRLAREKPGRGFSKAAAGVARASAGNYEAGQVARRAVPGADLTQYPYGDPQQFNKLFPFPQEAFSQDELLDFIRQWRESGTGKGR